MIARNEGKAGGLGKPETEKRWGIKNLPHNRPRLNPPPTAADSPIFFFVVPPKTPEKIKKSHGIPLVRGWVAPTVWDVALESLTSILLTDLVNERCLKNRN